ncbi:Serine/threonine-protein kinase PknD [Gimesia chilikensis]|uniref:Serine/threonine-protein kinase PknD n=1 Tax=Gimesia chilikensis TaxID=2605989 RepID=A0A517WEI0_9PLAN|nr:Serine/threonine-protein kinase PknD [Gimesia chilikensis]
MRPDENETEILSGLIALSKNLLSAEELLDSYLIWSRQNKLSLMQVLMDRNVLSTEQCATLETQVRSSIANSTDATESVDTSIQNTAHSDTVFETVLTDDLETGGPGSRVLKRAGQEIPVLREKITLKGLYSTGGMGQVWIAYDEILQREIALKELKSSMSDSTRNRERFFREAQLTGELDHPGVVPVYQYSADEESGQFYYTMRFIKGRTFTQHIHEYHSQYDASSKTGVTAELIRLLSKFVSLCQTIAYAHSRQIIHRDLKGDNVILGDFGEVIVLDWGLAKKLGDPLFDADRETVISPAGEEAVENLSETMQGEKLGTPAYMAPEQATGRIDQIDFRTDVYCLSAILYEILTDQPPFSGRSIVEVLDLVIHSTPKPPGKRVPGIPAELEQICLKGLSKNRDQRQQSARELANQVQTWISERAERKRTEEERERFFNLSLDLLAILDARGNLSQTNPAWEVILGWSTSDLKAMTVRDILFQEDHRQLTDDLEQILSGEALTAVEYRCLCKDGTYRWVLWNASLIAGESSIYLVGRDITERKQTEQTFHELLESAPDGMVVVNSSGQIVLVNTQLERLFKFPREELLGRSIDVLVPEQFRSGHSRHVARFFQSPDFRPMGSGLNLEGQRKSGEVFPVEISLSPVRTEQGLLVSAAVRDLSHRNHENRTS